MPSTTTDTPTRLKWIRYTLGLTQTELAARIGVTLRTVQRWEAGTTAPPGPALKLIDLIEYQAALRAAK